MACIRDAVIESLAVAVGLLGMDPFDATKWDIHLGEWNEGEVVEGSSLNCTWRSAAM